MLSDSLDRAEKKSLKFGIMSDLHMSPVVMFYISVANVSENFVNNPIQMQLRLNVALLFIERNTPASIVIM